MHYIVSIPVDPKLAEFIGKKGSENSITFYNRKADDNVIVGIAPSSIEEKFYALAECLLIADQALVSTINLDKLFGEIIVACSLINKHVIFTNDGNIDQFLKGIKIESYEITERDKAIERILAQKSNREGNVRIDIDKGFPVKGLGTVALGIVTRGVVKVHDELLHSSGKKAQIRSIQAQDVDIKEAAPGTRVGLVLKGVESDEIEKGDILSNVQVPRAGKITGEVKMSNINQEKIQVGFHYYFVSNFSVTFSTVEKIEGNTVSLRFEKKIPLEINDEFLLIREVSPRIFASGKVKTVSE